MENSTKSISFKIMFGGMNLFDLVEIFGKVDGLEFAIWDGEWNHSGHLDEVREIRLFYAVETNANRVCQAFRKLAWSVSSVSIKVMAVPELWNCKIRGWYFQKYGKDFQYWIRDEDKSSDYFPESYDVRFSDPIDVVPADVVNVVNYNNEHGTSYWPLKRMSGDSWMNSTVAVSRTQKTVVGENGDPSFELCESN